jgi:hypothetical protein
MYLFAFLTIWGGLGIACGISLVFLGISYSWYGKNFINSKADSGVRTGINFFNINLDHISTFGIGFLCGSQSITFSQFLYFEDIVNTLILYFLNHVARFFSISLLSPLIKLSGE